MLTSKTQREYSARITGQNHWRATDEKLYLIYLIIFFDLIQVGEIKGNDIIPYSDRLSDMK